MNIYTIVYLSK